MSSGEIVVLLHEDKKTQEEKKSLELCFHCENGNYYIII